MRPTPGELAQGMRVLLRAAGAELKTPGAKAQMRRVMSVLGGTRWDDAAFDLLRENELLRAGLEAFEEPGKHRALLGDRGLPSSFAEANARNLALRTALAGALEKLRGEAPAGTADRRRALALAFLERP